MSKLAAEAELLKMARLLGVEREEIEFLEGIAAEPLRVLRDAITEHLLEVDRPMYRRIARIAMRAPSRMLVALAKRFSPIIAAGVIAEIPARRLAVLAKYAPTDLVADIAVYMDPRRARDVFRMLPIEQIVDVALELDKRDDFATMSKFIDFIPDETLRAVEEAIPDEGRLLRVAFLMEAKNRVDHFFRMLPPERIQRLLDRVQADPEALLAEFLSLLIHVSYGFKRELGDIVAAQDEKLINGYIRGAHEQDLWGDLLPVVGAMSDAARQRLANLPVLREDEVQRKVLESAVVNDQWNLVIPLVGLMEEESRATVATHVEGLTSQMLRQICDAALVGEHWDIALDLIRRASPAKQAEFVAIVREIADIDPDLYHRVAAQAAAAGLEVGDVTKAAS